MFFNKKNIKLNINHQCEEKAQLDERHASLSSIKRHRFEDSEQSNNMLCTKRYRADKKIVSGREQIVNEFFPSDLTKLILSFMDKHEFQYVEYIDDDVDSIHDTYDNIIDYGIGIAIVFSKMYNIMNWYQSSYIKLLGIIDENTFLICNDLLNKYGIYRRDGPIKYITRSIGVYVRYTCNKYIIFEKPFTNTNRTSFYFHNIKEHNCIYIHVCHTVDDTKVMISNDIFYLHDESCPIVNKINVLTKENKKITFDVDWKTHSLQFTETEIIIVGGNEITFYDLDGNLITKTNIEGQAPIKYWMITHNYFYAGIDPTESHGKSHLSYHKYERIYKDVD
jgi:hypothetical protein